MLDLQMTMDEFDLGLKIGEIKFIDKKSTINPTEYKNRVFCTGYWNLTAMLDIEDNEWRPRIFYPKGSVVSYNDKWFVAVERTMSPPTDPRAYIDHPVQIDFVKYRGRDNGWRPI